ncbi:MAG: hypothetical protein CSB21_03500 [Deltaproteobacteria bacterium]|nr:MAG: hypothetical protein CSB21_03500 [Deltaproteobacteria bacterium]
MDYIKEYVKECEAANFMVRKDPAVSRFFHGVRMEMNEKTGKGWSEILRIHNGLYVGMGNYCLNHRLETCHSNLQKPFQLGIILSGHFGFKFPGLTKDVASAGSVWCFNGDFEKVFYTQYPGENMCGVSICLPQNLIESWLDTSCGSDSKGLEKMFLGSPSMTKPLLLAKELPQSSDFMRIARELIYSRRQTLPDKLRFESLSLDLLHHILTLKEPSSGSRIERTRQARASIDEAVDILRMEWNDPPSISELSRRVGLNECYLKKGFRKYLGMPIGAYIRQLRMTKALEIIETGRYSILDTAIFVGYSNPGHFSAAFKKFYGHLPSYYLPRYDKIF